MKVVPIAAALGSIVLFSACATPQARVSTALIEAGVPQALANCFADDVTSRLTLSELRAIAASVSQARERGRALTLGEAVALAGQAGDLRTAGVVLAAAARCG